MKKKIILAIATCLLALKGFAADQEEKSYPWVEYDAASVSPTPKIQAGCNTLSMNENSFKTYKPFFPTDGFIAKTSGYAVFDFQLDENGSPKNIEIVAVSKKAKTSFKKASLKKLKDIKFDLSEDWLKSCKEQTYRIGYAYRLMSPCTNKEFPKPIINVCVVGEMQEIR